MKPTLTRVPRPRPLPGMQDRASLVLDTLAAEYVDLRLRRIALTEEEAALKARILAELHRQKRERYTHGGVDIWIVRAEDAIKVKVSQPDEDDEDDEEDDDQTPRDPAAPKPPRHEGDRPAPREEPPQEDQPRARDDEAS